MAGKIIGITGGSGSGKTAFLTALKDHFKPGEVAILSQDDYYFPLERQQRDENGVTNFDLPGAVDIDQFREDIHRIQGGKAVQRNKYLFNNPKAIPSRIFVPPAPVIVLEGLFLLFPEEIKSMLDLSIIIHAEASQRLARRIIRDREERNYPVEDVVYRFENHVTPAFEKYIRPYYSTADIVINNTGRFSKGLELLVRYIRWELRLSDNR